MFKDNGCNIAPNEVVAVPQQQLGGEDRLLAPDMSGYLGVEYEAYGLTGRNAIRLNYSLKNFATADSLFEIDSKTLFIDR